MEKYPSGSRGAPAKGVDRVTGARVRIPPSPPNFMDKIDANPFCQVKSRVLSLSKAILRGSNSIDAYTRFSNIL